MRVIQCANASEIDALVQAASLPRFKSADVNAQHADVHLCAVSESGDVRARCSLWWNHVPAYGQHHLGVIGHYAAAEDGAVVWTQSYPSATADPSKIAAEVDSKVPLPDSD